MKQSILLIITLLLVTYVRAETKSFAHPGDQMQHHVETVSATNTFDNQYWDICSSASIRGTNNLVGAMARYGGELIVGGGFTAAGDTLADLVAAWDGTSYRSIASGPKGSRDFIYCMTVWERPYNPYNDTVLIAGGRFTQINGVPANNIAQWDGVTWSPLGPGLDVEIDYDFVSGLEVFNNSLYAAGGLTGAGATVLNHVARWDGSSWSDVAGGTDSVVYDLTVVHDQSGDDSLLVAGGTFAQAGSMPASRIAAWDGTSWSTFGSGMTGGLGAFISALTEFDGCVVAGGSFPLADGGVVNSIAIWCGSSWQPLGEGVSNIVFGLNTWYDAIQGDTLLIVGGDFSWTLNGVGDTCHAPRIAAWNGSRWQTVGDIDLIATWYVSDFETYQNDLYAGGYLWAAGDSAASYIAAWDGADWESTGDGNGLDGAVNCLAAFGDQLIAGGAFRCAGGAFASYISALQDTSWSQLGDGMGLFSEVHAVCTYDDDLIAAGNLYLNGITPYTQFNIVAWDSTTQQWSSLGDGINGTVHSLLNWCCHPADGDILLAGGDFSTAGMVNSDYFSVWDGSSWSSGGGSFDAPVRAMTLYQGAPVIGGDFTNPANHIVGWDGTSWTALGSGMNGPVYAVATWYDPIAADTVLVAGGDFTVAGGAPASRIAAWNGTTWSALGLGVDDRVRALAIYRHRLFVGGEFITASGIVVNRVAMWNGADWWPLGSGVNEPVSAFIPSAGSLQVGGEFLTAGGQFAAYVARWTKDYCCEGIRGNVDGLGTEPTEIDSSDLGLLVAYLFSPPGAVELACVDEADVDGLGGDSPVDSSDLGLLVAFLFADPPGSVVLPMCP